ncbi:proton-coupled folate transporter-like [Acropora palmata]|uniref:proton-coupled folate transporter-like n=1 Tax=Acropora palmata TaxID=6131 RepID=UPI003DA0B0E9
MPRHKLPAWRRYLTVEPALFFYAYGFMTGYPLYRQYVYSVFSEQKGFPYREVAKADEGLGCQGNDMAQNSTLRELEREVQSLSTRMDLMLTFFRTIPSLLLAPFWGAWTDKSGRRKPALIFPVIGGLLQTIIMLAVLYLKLPLYVMFVGSAISGFSGFITVLTIAVMSYIADTTEKNGIAFRFAIVQLMALLGGFISQLTSGLWIERFGFIAPVWLILTCYSVAALWVIFLVPENCVRVSNEKNRFFELNHLKRLVNVFKVPRTGGSRRMLLLLMFVGAICTFTDEGVTGVKTLFIIKSPLCFSPSLVGYFLAYTMLTFGLGAAVGVKLFRTFFSEKITGGIGVVSQMIGMASFAFSNRTWLVFLGQGLAVFKDCTGPIIIGILSRTVAENEQGSLFCAYGLLNMVCQFAGATIFNNVYEATLGLDFDGLVFVVCSAMKLIPLGIICAINITPPFDDRAHTEEAEIRTIGDEENPKQQMSESGEENNNPVNMTEVEKIELETEFSPMRDEFIDSTKL